VFVSEIIDKFFFNVKGFVKKIANFFF